MAFPSGSEGADRVREHTAPRTRRELDERLAARVSACGAAGPEAIERRLAELRCESDIERVLEMNASTLALSGVALGALVDRRLLAIPAIVTAFLLQHAIQGWCPPLPLLRRLGYRSRQEIDYEVYALKALRGDFNQLASAAGAESVQQALHAAGTRKETR